jgi:hypothetical protein
MDRETLYSKIETLIIHWSNDGTKTAGELTRQIMELIQPNDKLDTDFMYKWINKHSGR